jgi:hypothetical protein
LGRVSVSSRRRVPKPPARITASMSFKRIVGDSVRRPRS